MRVVLDLQACQNFSRFQGIGRYSLSLATNLIDELIKKDCDVIILLSDSFPDEALKLQSDLSSRFLGLKYCSFSVLSPCASNELRFGWRQFASRITREHVIACLQPDIVHIASLLAEGWSCDTVGSVGLLGPSIPTALTHYDLIPFSMSEYYLDHDINFKNYYLEKLEYVKKADLLLAISDYSRSEAIEKLGLSHNSVINISSAVDGKLAGQSSNRISSEPSLSKKYGIKKDFLLYAPGGFDYRKNFETLFEAYALLPGELKEKYNLVIASRLEEGIAEDLLLKCKKFGLKRNEVIFTDYVPDDDLVMMYKNCRAYVFPSLHEGFGLPVLEAMEFGSVVIASNTSGLPEAHGLMDALFDPHSAQSMSEKMILALEDKSFRKRLKNHAIEQCKKFSWKKTASTAANALESLHQSAIQSGWSRVNFDELPSVQEMLTLISLRRPELEATSDEIALFKDCIRKNRISARNACKL